MYTFLLVEDSDTDVQACQDTIKRINDQYGAEEYRIKVSRSFDEAIIELANNYDGVIVDIKIGDKNDGNKILHKIIDSFRMPACVMTGTPDTDLGDESPIQVYKKGETSYEVIVQALKDICDTGLFNVIGGKGIIETTMNKIFWKNLYSQISLWMKLKKEGHDTEKILLRYAIAHIQELLDSDVPSYISEEMYIKPPLTNILKTGCIVKSAKDGLFYIVLSPPCDLALHDGEPKTDRIMLCEINRLDKVSKLVIGEAKSEKAAKNSLLPIIKNNHKEYYHWLPGNSLFEGGYINFRNIITFPRDDFIKEFAYPLLRVQEYFVKDILARFSAYYARQGQPDFDFDREAGLLVAGLSSSSTE